ncbi:MAG: hypothetical protein M3P08_08400 [Thermoproteota archaeon]|jgi:hypothetical protein|nr:hypothetical protein [Thermoproteota archaeon]
MKINKRAAFSKELTISCMGFIILIILPPLLLFNNTGLLAFSANTKIAGGYGAGTITCPNKLVFNNEQIQFQVNKSKAAGVGSNEQGTIKSSLISGFWKVGTLNMPHTTHINLGSISDLHLSSSLHNISVKGIEQQDNICKNGNDNMNTSVKLNYINITGQCNTKDTRMSFTSLDGKKGTFNGTIVCNALR